MTEISVGRCACGEREMVHYRTVTGGGMTGDGATGDGECWEVSVCCPACGRRRTVHTGRIEDIRLHIRMEESGGTSDADHDEVQDQPRG